MAEVSRRRRDPWALDRWAAGVGRRRLDHRRWADRWMVDRWAEWAEDRPRRIWAIHRLSEDHRPRPWAEQVEVDQCRERTGEVHTDTGPRQDQVSRHHSREWPRRGGRERRWEDQCRIQCMQFRSSHYGKSWFVR